MECSGILGFWNTIQWEQAFLLNCASAAHPITVCSSRLTDEHRESQFCLHGSSFKEKNKVNWHIPCEICHGSVLDIFYT